MIEVVNLSSKGQLVIPKNMREEMGLSQKDKFVLYNTDDTILLKKIRQEDLKNRLNQLVNKTSKAFKKAGIKKEDVNNAIKEARNIR